MGACIGDISSIPITSLLSEATFYYIRLHSYHGAVTYAGDRCPFALPTASSSLDAVVMRRQWRRRCGFGFLVADMLGETNV